MTPNELKDALAQFTGTEGYHRLTYASHVLFTDGVAYLAETAGAYWLMDMIASHLSSVPAEEAFVLARYAGTPGASGLFSLTDDEPANRTYGRQSVEYSDFPLDEIKLYAVSDGIQWVVLLPSEY